MLLPPHPHPGVSHSMWDTRFPCLQLKNLCDPFCFHSCFLILIVQSHKHQRIRKVWMRNMLSSISLQFSPQPSNKSQPTICSVKVMPYTISKQIFFKVCAIEIYNILKSMQVCKIIYAMRTNNLYWYFSVINFQTMILFWIMRLLLVSWVYFSKWYRISCKWVQTFLCYKKQYRREKQKWRGKNGKSAKITISFNLFFLFLL